MFGDEVFVTDSGDFRLKVFSADGEFRRAWGGLGRTFGSFARPKGLTVDPEGNIWVVDAAFQNVQGFDREGQLLMAFGGELGDAPGGLSLPAHIAAIPGPLDVFQRYAEPGHSVRFVFMVVNQTGLNKLSFFGFVGPGGQSDADDETP